MPRSVCGAPLAVVGFACRFPGGLNDIDTFWAGLLNGHDAISDIPAERWNVDRFYADDDQANGKMYVRRGGFLDQDIRDFDAAFFGISPREASYMDPQQRLLLEVAWEAMENGGLDPLHYEGREVGVYVGGFTLDHLLNQLGSGNRENIGPHSAVGSTMTILSARIAHAFNFRGPAFSVDTACSSSLVAFHYACQDLWSNRCEMSVVGGSNVIFRPEYPIAMCKGKFLARDGRCKSFDASGDGYARGEGCGVIVLKRLADAEAAGDPIWAIVEATGVNQDGRTNGITVPSGEAQEALMRRVLDEAGIPPFRVHYVEAHGTGTIVGDPIEAGAIGAVYGGERNDAGCIIGSVKSNIGHLEAAAGVAGLIKLVLSLHHNIAPALATLKEPNPNIPFRELGIRLADRQMPIVESIHQPVYAAINSFGYGGTNAHAILRRAEAVADAAPMDSKDAKPRAYPYILPISTRSKEALPILARRYRDRLAADDISLDDFAYSAARRRSHATHRAAIVGADIAAIIQGLGALSDQTPNPAVFTGVQSYGGARQPVFVYTGMGPQWWAMGQQLWREDAVYRETVGEADAVFQRIAGFSILDEMLKSEEESRITETQFAQPANFMVQIGVTAMLRAAGITPGAIVGHSVGEVSSSYVAGALSLKDALTVSFHRSRVQKKAANSGGMLAAALTQEEAEAMLVGRGDRVSIGAINGPRTITFSGDVAVLDDMAAALESQGLFNRALRVEVPYHSPMMEPLKQELADCLAHITPRIPEMPLYSTVTGDRVNVVAYDAEYWTHNIREPVLFAEAIRNLLADDFTTFVEVGPHPVLSAALKECFAAARSEAVAIETLRRKEPERPRVTNAVAQIYAAGSDIDWSRQYPKGRFVRLPNYPWQRERLWNEGLGCVIDRAHSAEGPLLGLATSPASHEWAKDLATASLHYLMDHVVDGLPILPGAAFIEAILEMAHARGLGKAGSVIRDLKLLKALPLDRQAPQRLITTFAPETRTVTLSSVDANNPTEAIRHATATVVSLVACPMDRVDLETLAAGMEQGPAPDALYADFEARGLQYGPAFRTIHDLRMSPDRSRMLVQLRRAQRFDLSEGPYLANPTLLDGCFQALIALLADDRSKSAYLPTSIRQIRLHAPLPDDVVCHGTLTKRTPREIVCDLALYDADGGLVGIVEGAHFTALAGGAAANQPVPTGAYRYIWTRNTAEGEPVRLGTWLVVDAAHQTVAAACIDGLRAFGATKVATASAATDGDGPTALPPGETAAAVAFLTRLGPVDGVVFVAAAEPPYNASDPTGERNVAALMALAHALAERGTQHRPRLYVVTQQAFRVSETDATVFPAQGAVAGFARVAYNEIEGLRCTTVDIPAIADAGVLQALCRELVVDSAADEVAIRSEGRFTSELLNSDLLAGERMVTLDPANRPAFALAADPAGGGTIIRETTLEPVGDEEIRIALDTAVIGGAAFGSGGSDDETRLHWMEIDGVITETGSAVTDLAPGTRVCGYAPLAFGSHVTAERSMCHLQPLPAGFQASTAPTTLILSATGEALATAAAVTARDQMLVWANAVGLAVAAAARARGADVTLLQPTDLGDADLGPLADLYRFNATVTGIDRALAARTGGAGFSVLCVPLESWSHAFDLSALRWGGRLIDLDDFARPTLLDARVGALYRRDPAVLLPQCSGALLEIVGRLAVADATNAIPALEPDYAHVADLSAIDRAAMAVCERVALHYQPDERALEAVSADGPRITSDSSYLITGAFGGLGQELAHWLVARGARHLVLVGRRGADTDDKCAFVAGLQAKGATVHAAACDIGVQQQVAALFEEIGQSMPPLKGVFHSAAVIDDAPIIEMTRDRLARVMAPKATGAWLLHALTEGMDLDYFVLFSSIAPLVGNSRQSNYAAANAFLDALAWHRHLRGLPATSLNWGAILDAGMVSQDERIAHHLRSIGLTPIPVAQAFAGMARALARGVTQVCISETADWSQWAIYETLGGESPRFHALVSEARGSKDQSALARLQSRLRELDAEDRVEGLGLLLAAIYATELRLPEDAVDIDRPVASFGVDSLLGLNIQMGVEINLGLKISTLELIGNNTLRNLAGKCLADLGLEGNAALVAAE